MTLRDQRGKPMLGRVIGVGLSTGGMDAERDESATTAVDRGDGTYATAITTKASGEHTIVATESKSGLTATARVRFVAGPVTSISVRASDPRSSPTRKSSLLRAFAHDRFGNAVARPAAALSFETDFGVLSNVVFNDDGSFGATLTSDELGSATVRVTDANSGVRQRAEVLFPAVHLATREEPDGKLALAVALDTAPTSRPLGRFDLGVTYPDALVRFVEASEEPAGGPALHAATPRPGFVTLSSDTPRPRRDPAATVVLRFEPLATGTVHFGLSVSLVDVSGQPLPGLPVTSIQDPVVNKPVRVLCVKFWYVKSVRGDVKDRFRKDAKYETTDKLEEQVKAALDQLLNSPKGCCKCESATYTDLEGKESKQACFKIEIDVRSGVLDLKSNPERDGDRSEAGQRALLDSIVKAGGVKDGDTARGILRSIANDPDCLNVYVVDADMNEHHGGGSTEPPLPPPPPKDAKEVPGSIMEWDANEWVYVHEIGHQLIDEKGSKLTPGGLFHHDTPADNFMNPGSDGRSKDNGPLKSQKVGEGVTEIQCAFIMHNRLLKPKPK